VRNVTEVRVPILARRRTKDGQMEEQTEHRIEESKKKAERTLEEMMFGHTITKRWITPKLHEDYIFCFSIDGRQEEKIGFRYRIMTDGRTLNNSRFIETYIREKLKSMGL
jgi:hypothetical protein